MQHVTNRSSQGWLLDPEWQEYLVMDDELDEVEGAGLAAPQVGVSKRVFTYRIGGVEGHIINPVLENS